MHIRLSKEQTDWIKTITGMENTQEAFDWFASLMRKEGIPASEILIYVTVMMERGVKSPKD